jgi:hypothetical protein
MGLPRRRRRLFGSQRLGRSSVVFQCVSACSEEERRRQAVTGLAGGACDRGAFARFRVGSALFGVREGSGAAALVNAEEGAAVATAQQF